MIAFTIMMALFYVVYQLFMSVSLSYMQKEQDGELSEQTKKEGAILIGCLGIPIMLGYSFTYIIFILYFLKYDPLSIPTYIMITLLLLSIIRSIIINAIKKFKGKKNKKVKRGLWSHMAMSITAVFYIYALYVLIVGI